jgi:Mg-chelatase subunit ChlI
MDQYQTTGAISTDDSGPGMIEDSNPENNSDDEINESTVLKDRYGFFVTDKYHKFLEVPVEVCKQRKEKESERARKWIKMIKQWEKYSGPSRFQKLKSRTRKGIPDVVRGYAWYQFAHGDEIKTKYPDVRQISLDDLPSVVIDEVSNFHC